MEHEESPTVWLYWDSPEGADPGYIELCRRTIEKWAGDYRVIVLNKENAFNHVPGLHEEFPNIPVIAHRADYVRAACLASRGGIWLDIDTVVLKPLTLCWALTAVNGCVMYGWKDKEPSIGMIAARGEHPLLLAWREAIESRIDQSLSQNWSGFGYDLLWPLAKSIGFTQIPRTACAPTHWTETGVFGQDRTIASVLKPDTVMVQLYNRGLSAKMGGMSSEELMRSETLLARLFEQAMAVPSPSPERLRDLESSMEIAAAGVACSLAATGRLPGLTWVDGSPLFDQSVRTYDRLMFQETIRSASKREDA